jgi:hypothetical protein
MRAAGASADGWCLAACETLKMLKDKNRSAGAKALLIRWGLSARLKSCPDTSGFFIEFFRGLYSPALTRFRSLNGVLQETLKSGFLGLREQGPNASEERAVGHAAGGS